MASPSDATVLVDKSNLRSKKNLQIILISHFLRYQYNQLHGARLQSYQIQLKPILFRSSLREKKIVKC